MLRFPLPWLALFCFCTAAPAETPSTPVKTSPWDGFERLDFQVAGRDALLVKPAKAAEGNPWIWRTEFFGHEPQADLALLAAGWHVAYIHVSDMYGAPPAIEIMNSFHDELTRVHGLNQRAVLEGFSRGGLYAGNFAIAHPDKTAALYLDAAVLDVRTWPGGMKTNPRDPEKWENALKLFGLTEETAASYDRNAVDQAGILVAAHIPIIAVCGGADKSVLFPENTGLLEKRYKELGGKIQVIIKPGADHHPHSLKDPKPIVDFLLENAYQH
jgi:pimeloyl-ACP methyl ester carboxylesterase